MDSRLLNVFHEDPFDGNFAKYETEPSFWSPNDDLQLTDTLNGILPIAPTDAHSLLGHDGDEDVELQSSKNLLIYSDFVEQQLNDQEANALNAQVYQAFADSEVEVAYEQHERHLSAAGQYGDLAVAGLGGSHIEEDEEEGEDVQSQCSNSTFRTRTDSSSIGDYESHSSDYDDDDEEPVPEPELEQERKHNTSLLRGNVDALDECSDRKSRTLSTNTIVSEADALGLNIDVNNFDLADFITKDDFSENISACRLAESKRIQETASLTHSKVSLEPPSTPSGSAGAATASVVRKPTAVPTKLRDSDDDSDSIIDVETVDVVDVDETLWVKGQLAQAEAASPEDLCYVDNVKADPSWSPKGSAKKPLSLAKEPKLAPMENQEIQARGATGSAKPKATNNICLVPNKKQCDFLKRKVAAGAASKSNKAASKKTQEGKKSAIGSKQQRPAASTGLGLGGKNLALLKHNREAAAASVPPVPATATATAPKRKLNLEEYKQRRGAGGTAVAKTGTKVKPTPPKQPKLEQQRPPPTGAMGALGALKPMPVTTPSNQQQQKTVAIAQIVNSLKCPPIKGGPTAAALPMDPITVAKNKVLRMLEMKRAQQLKIIDSRVSAKVPRVTKLPPLKDIVKDTYRVELEEDNNSEAPTATTTTPRMNTLRPDLDALIIVSASCNTDITIPPNQLSKASPRSLLKSSVLLYNMSNGKDAKKNMSNSLIASIQSEVVRQTSSTAMATLLPKSNAGGGKGAKPPSGTETNVPHGEDMVIMHLPKNRERKTLVNMSTQTDLQPEFPLLVLPATTRQSRERSRRKYRKRRVPGSDESSSSRGSSSDSSSLASYRSRSRSRSRSHSIERLRSLDATATCGGSSIGNGGYSSRSTHRHRSSVSSSSYSEAGKYERRQRRTSYNKRRSKNQQPNRAGYSSSGSEISDRERSRSRSPHRPLRRSRSRSQSEARFENNNNNNRRGFVDRNVSQPAVEERRIVYVGRIEQETTKELLRRKFLAYGNIKQITIHYKENGMKYGFVTYERAQDAFTAIDTSPKDPQINMYDISFGGRRAFCRASYADLDNAGINNYHSYVFPKEAPAPKPQEDSFEALLLKVKAKLNAGKPETPATGPSTAPAAAPAPDHSQI
ncbi:uncharacterized protein LOC6591591 [Drosophila persimilis]|uniref:uncharacterized protein LOC6591591 n=1 Tax=Drosophila persimilis TaxID=7234 RepID=UPI000F077B2A|nr:uncharacterized protein LOC6591591 [Drosophila persimilis]